MKVIIAGGRDFNDRETFERGIRLSGFEITEVVSGGAMGADRMGEEWAVKNDIPFKVFPASWNKHGNAAGPMRNKQMAEYAQALIAFDNGGPGTRDMIKQAREHGLRVFRVHGSTFEELP